VRDETGGKDGGSEACGGEAKGNSQCNPEFSP